MYIRDGHSHLWLVVAVVHVPTSLILLYHFSSSFAETYDNVINGRSQAHITELNNDSSNNDNNAHIVVAVRKYQKELYELRSLRNNGPRNEGLSATFGVTLDENKNHSRRTTGVAWVPAQDVDQGRSRKVQVKKKRRDENDPITLALQAIEDTTEEISIIDRTRSKEELLWVGRSYETSIECESGGGTATRSDSGCLTIQERERSLGKGVVCHQSGVQSVAIHSAFRQEAATPAQGVGMGFKELGQLVTGNSNFEVNAEIERRSLICRHLWSLRQEGT